MINETNDKIRYTAFIYFLEKGYESTNIRDICKKVDIKPSSLYFYYKSKEELFFSIYDGIWNEKIRYMKEIKELDQNICPKTKFHNFYKGMIEFYTQDITKQKFLLRYNLFPAEEISISIRDKFKYWTDEENKVILDIVNRCIDGKFLDPNRSPNDYVRDYKRFETNQITEMIISNMKISSKDMDILWARFCNSITLKGL